MASSGGSWERVRQSFADQFEQQGTSFIYRKSQKGEAIRVSAEERDRFLDEFARNSHRANWIIFVAIAVTIGGTITLSVFEGFDVPQAAFMVAIVVAIIPYFVYFKWAWAAPARELVGRTPVARERSPEEFRRLALQRITYGQLASAAAGGLIIPFVATSRQNLFDGWNRVWLVFGGGLVLLAAVQAFRKWRIEQEHASKNIITRSPSWSVGSATADASSEPRAQLWRYVPLGLIVLALAFIRFLPAGKQLALTPTFVLIMGIGAGGWSLFTVAQGFTKGQIEPFARGFYSTYERETQPKRFWASMAWNSFFGCICLWAAFMMNRDAAAQQVRDQCYDYHRSYPAQDKIRACDQLIEGKVSLGGWTRADVFVDRGIAYAEAGRPDRAVSDYSAAIRLQPNDPQAYYDRALVYKKSGHIANALHDFGAAIQQRPDYANAYLERGLLYLDTGRFDEAIGDFTRSHDADSQNAWPIADRGLAYAWKRDAAHAREDFAAARAIDPTNYVVSHGEALLSMQEGDTRGAIYHLSAALDVNPNDAWGLRKRAEAYRLLGDDPKADADMDRLYTISAAKR